MLTLEEFRTYSGSGTYPLFVDCRTMGYRDALSLQEEILAGVMDMKLPGVFLFVEHPPVITLGIRKGSNRLLSTEEALNASGIEVVPIRRGGGSTAHNPGQLVIYPVIHLARTGFRVAPYVRFLEETAIELLGTLNVCGERRNRFPGVWVEDRKIASVGVQLSHGVTMHGIAVNLYNDLSIFDHIIACGIEGVEMTNAEKEGGVRSGMDELKQRSAEITASRLPEKIRGGAS